MKPQEYLPFDLEKALAGWPVVTREGIPVTQLQLFDTYSDYPLYVVLFGGVVAFTKNGQYIKTQGNKNDLFLLPQPAGTEVCSGYLNVYSNHEGYLYPSKELADAGSCDVRRHACVAVKWIKKP